MTIFKKRIMVKYWCEENNTNSNGKQFHLHNHTNKDRVQSLLLNLILCKKMKKVYTAFHTGNAPASLGNKGN